MGFQDLMKKCQFCNQFQEEGWGRFFTVLQIVPSYQQQLDVVVTRKWICSAFSHSCANQLVEIFIVDELGVEISPNFATDQGRMLKASDQLKSIMIHNLENWLDSAVRDCHESESVHLWLPKFELKNRQAKVLQQLRQLHEELESVLLLQQSIPFSNSEKKSIHQFNDKINKNIKLLHSLI